MRAWKMCARGWLTKDLFKGALSLIDPKWFNVSAFYNIKYFTLKLYEFKSYLPYTDGKWIHMLLYVLVIAIHIMTIKWWRISVLWPNLIKMIRTNKINNGESKLSKLRESFRKCRPILSGPENTMGLWMSEKQ